MYSFYFFTRTIRKLTLLFLCVHFTTIALSQHISAPTDRNSHKTLQVIAYPEYENPLTICIRYDSNFLRDMVYIEILNDNN